jgi:hypothetical protein
VLIGCGSQSATTATGRLAVDPAEATVSIDADGVDSAQELHFKLKNIGGKAFTIRKIETPCCGGGVKVASPIEKQTLQPGDSTELVLKATPPKIGRFEKSVIVYTDLPDSSPIPLKFIGGKLHPPYVIGEKPLDVELVGAKPGAAIEHKMKICSIETAEAKPWILGMASGSDLIAAELTGEPEDRPVDPGVVTRYYEFLIRAIVPQTTDIPVAAGMHIQTASESQQPLRSFLVTVRLVPTIRAVPAAFIILKQEDFPIERRVLLVPKDGKDVRPEVVSSLPAWVSVGEDEAAGKLPPGAKRYLIRVNRPTEATLSDVTIEFRCEDETINVPVRFAES